ncbi:MAG: hypothetical protein QM778_35485 [Myxococcales bacterium]
MQPTSHPDQPVRHSYPLAVSDAGFSSSLSLLLSTLPYALVRFGILFGVSVATLIWYGVTFGGGAFIGQRVPLLGYAWIFGGLGVWGYLYWFIVRYFLYLLKAGHIAVLTELMTHGRVNNGQEGMFQYGTRVVKERFGEVNAMFALDALVAGVVGAFNRTLNWISNLLPIPGLSSLTNLVTAVVRAATTYIDETLFSYSLARGDENKWRSAKDGLIYYAQNSQEILKTGVWIVVLDWALTFVAWAVCLVPAGVLAWLLPPGGFGQFGVLLLAALAAANLRSAFLKPLFLIMVMVKFHVSVRNQPINLEWDQKLSSISDKFVELKSKIFEAPTAPNLPAVSPSP